MRMDASVSGLRRERSIRSLVTVGAPPVGFRAPAGTAIRAIIAAVAGLLLGGLAFGLSGGDATDQAGAPAAASAVAKQAALRAYGRQPLRFEQNRGQSDARVRFLARGAGYTMFLTPSEAVLSLVRPARHGAQSAHAAVRIRLLGSNPHPRVEGLGRLGGETNYLKGSDRSSWRTNVAGYGRVRYRGTYPGIDLVYHGRQGRLEYDFNVAPGADPGRIALGISGGRSVSLSRDGELVVRTPAGTLRQHKPVVYQTVAGARRNVAGGYVLKGHGRVGFRLGRYDHSRPLVIDPVIAYSTYLGGAGEDAASGIAADGQGNAYVTGLTAAPDFPIAGAAPFQSTLRGFNDAFVTKIDSTGALVYSTFLGSTGNEGFSTIDGTTAIKVDASGRAHVAGATSGIDFPIAADAYRTAPGAGFVSVLNPQGSGLDYSTYFPAAVGGIALDPSGKVYVAGITSALDFPTTATAFQTTIGGGDDVFVSELDLSRSGAAALVASTYLGGSGTEVGGPLAVDASGVYVVGGTDSTDFPLNNALQAVNNGNADVFVTKLNASLSSLAYSTYLGGTGSEGTSAPTVAVAVDSSGHAFVAGRTDSSDFPTKSPFHVPDANTGNAETFVTKLAPDGGSLAYSSYLMRTSFGNTAIAVDGSGGAFVIGQSVRHDLPTVDPVSPEGLLPDPFVVRVKPDGSGLSFASYLGGGDVAVDDIFHVAVAVDPAGAAYLAASTDSADFPTQNSLQPLSGGFGQNSLQDGFVVKITPDAAGAPVVSGLSPRSGAAGTSVTVDGSGFTGVQAVRFGDTPAATFSVDSAGSITAVAPAHAAAQAPVTVTTAGGTSAVNPINRFVYADGGWSATGSLVMPSGDPFFGPDSMRWIELASGEVLRIGGDPTSAESERYDSTTGRWTQTGSLKIPRFGFTATALPSGKALVAGGCCDAIGNIKTAEVYDPASGTWTTTGDLTDGRAGATATLLASGKVLVAGGDDIGTSAELYDPVTGSWAKTGNLRRARTAPAGAQAVLLSGLPCTGSSPPDWCGDVLIVAGDGDGTAPGDGTSAELYDPGTGKWSDTGSLSIRHGGGWTTVALQDGRVLLAGGTTGSLSSRTVELYDPATGRWSLTASLPLHRGGYGAALLPDGRVLAAGGSSGLTPLNSAVIYDPLSAQWSSAGFMTSYRGYSTNAVSAVTLKTGKVLVGGTTLCSAGFVDCPPADSTELFTPAAPPGAGPAPQPPAAPQAAPAPQLGPQPQPQPSKDTKRPVISSLRVSPRRLRVGSRLPLVTRTRTATTIRFRLSEAAKVRLSFERAVSGRRVGKSCKPATRRLRNRRRCTRYIAARPSIRLAGDAGLTRVRFQGRLSRRVTLRPGKYRLTATARDQAGNQALPKITTFSLLAKKPAPKR